jgi:hypothetical protein
MTTDYTDFTDLGSRRSARAIARIIGDARGLAGRAKLAASLAALLVFSSPARAGGGPENVILVVNSASAASQTVANHFIELRHIPASNVVYLDWSDPAAKGKTDHFPSSVKVDELRDKILRPILQTAGQRKLGDQVDYIIYSADFPWAVDFQSDLPPQWKDPNVSNLGSLSGMTYLLYAVMSKDVANYVGTPALLFTSNHYMRLREKWKGTTYEIPIVQKGLIQGEPRMVQESVNQSTVGSHGFRNWYGWGAKGELIEGGGSRYLLSTMLGVIDSGPPPAGRGNSIEEIEQYLKRSAAADRTAADGTMPKGTIYFMANGDIRYTTRQPPVEMVVDELKLLGVNAVIDQGAIPQNKPDVQGLLCGISDFDWKASGSKILPGAICETLTSWAGNFDRGTGQTPLTEFLRYGAAGASGTVTEPYAIQNKFPYATIQLHYARGCSLAEAFYQSVYAPYQLLIVGDPLCQPWANIPEVTVHDVSTGDELKAGVLLKGKVSLKPAAKLPRRGKVDRFELFVDGLRTDATGADDPLTLDTAQYADGDHELRVVGIENSAIESQGRAIIPVRFSNYGRSMKFTASPERIVRRGEKITLSAEANSVRGVAFYHNYRVVARFEGEKGEVTVDSRMFGEGPVILSAIGWGASGAVDSSVYSAPIQLTIEGMSGR